MYLCIYIYIYPCIHVSMYLSIYPSIYISICIFISINIYIYIYTNIAPLQKKWCGHHDTREFGTSPVARHCFPLSHGTKKTYHHDTRHGGGSHDPTTSIFPVKNTCQNRCESMNFRGTMVYIFGVKKIYIYKKKKKSRLLINTYTI